MGILKSVNLDIIGKSIEAACAVITDFFSRFPDFIKTENGRITNIDGNISLDFSQQNNLSFYVDLNNLEGKQFSTQITRLETSDQETYTIRDGFSVFFVEGTEALYIGLHCLQSISSSVFATFIFTKSGCVITNDRYIYAEQHISTENLIKPDSNNLFTAVPAPSLINDDPIPGVYKIITATNYNDNCILCIDGKLAYAVSTDSSRTHSSAGYAIVIEEEK